MTARLKRGAPTKLVFVLVGELDSVILDENEQINGAETLGDLFQSGYPDQGLRAFRRIYSLCFPDIDKRTSEERLMEIRGLAMPALGDLGDELEAAGLARVDADKSFKFDQGVYLARHQILPARELRRRVRVPDRRLKAPLADLIWSQPANPFLEALRQTLSLTFREATTPDQHDQLLEEIRFLASTALLPCNEILERIRVEPIASSAWRRFVKGVDTWDIEPGDADPHSEDSETAQ